MGSTLPMGSLRPVITWPRPYKHSWLWEVRSPTLKRRHTGCFSRPAASRSRGQRSLCRQVKDLPLPVPAPRRRTFYFLLVRGTPGASAFPAAATIRAYDVLSGSLKSLP
ncbi:uncharacterized protein LOC143261981 [Megalopta genalis]|uniref:uncharacterized protein LOC143261981 n=1 Tax=Megalopta genalis TaxID=115081 RepID=UPI003FCFF376